MSGVAATPSANDAPFGCRWDDCHEYFPSLSELFTHTTLEHLPAVPATHTAPLFPLTPSTTPSDSSMASPSPTPSVSPAPAPHESSPAPSEDAPDALEGSHECGWAGCSDSFPTAKALTDHLSSEHVGGGKSSYKCLWVDCDRQGRATELKKDLNRHLQTHTGYKPIKCKVCGKGCTHSQDLKIHMNTHTGAKPYVCDYPSCDKSFAAPSSLTTHKRLHSGVQPYKCRSCDKWFSDFSARTSHEISHSDIRSYGCTKCGGRFKRSLSVKGHVCRKR